MKQSRAQEISGGIKNALDRGEPLAKAKQSFINAGYTPQEVQQASQMIKTQPKKTTQTLPTPQKTPPKKSSKKILIISGIAAAAIITIALILGIFWDKIFG